MLSNIRFARLGLVGVLGLLATPALGGTASNTLTVTATVAATCSVSASSLNFGTYTVSTNTDQSGNISVTCTTGTPYTVELDGGTNASGSTRRMVNASSYLTYELYTDSGRGTVWNNTNTVAGTGTGAAQSIPLYGRIPSSQNVPAGTYTDTVQITVTY